MKSASIFKAEGLEGLPFTADSTKRTGLRTVWKRRAPTEKRKLPKEHAPHCLLNYMGHINFIWIVLLIVRQMGVKNYEFRIKSVKLRTVIVQDIWNNIRYEPHWESTN